MFLGPKTLTPSSPPHLRECYPPHDVPVRLQRVQRHRRAAQVERRQRAALVADQHQAGRRRRAVRRLRYAEDGGGATCALVPHPGCAVLRALGSGFKDLAINETPPREAATHASCSAEAATEPRRYQEMEPKVGPWGLV